MNRWIRKTWRSQPSRLRRLELAALAKMLDHPLDPARPTEKGDIVVAGLHGTGSGVGEMARLMLERFRASGLAAHAANLSRFAILEDFDAGPLWPSQATTGGVAIFHINPDLFNLMKAAVGRARLQQRRIIGVWAWELETIPRSWVRTIDSVDEIWVLSRFVAEAFRKEAAGKPIHVVAPPIDINAIPTVPRRDPLPQFQGRTVVFFMYDARSVHARKNPEGAIEAFRRASAGNPDPVLVIKVNNADAWPECMMRLGRAAEGLANVHIMQKKFSQDGMRDLLARVDIVMSLHHAEGFGFLMAEGMAAGKPVIATGWSGNMDFMSPSTSVPIDCKLVPVIDPQHIYDKLGAVWAEPDIGLAAAALRRLLADPAERQRMGQAARAQIAHYAAASNWFASLPESFWAMLDDRDAKRRVLESLKRAAQTAPETTDQTTLRRSVTA